MKVFNKSGILILMVVVISLLSPCDTVFAQIDYTGISVSECEKISDFIRTDEMINNISFALSENVEADDINISNCYMMNMFMFPEDFNEKWDVKDRIKEIYGDMMFYTIPIIIKDKKAVISLRQIDGQYKFSGITYGDSTSIYFIDEEEIKKTIKEAGILEESINYSDVLFAGFANNTLFVHINTEEKDYLIPYTAIDLSEFYEKNLYKSGEIYETSEVLKMMIDSSMVSLSEDGNKENGTLEVPLGGNGYRDQMNLSNKGSEEDVYPEKTDLTNYNGSQGDKINKNLIISGILVTSTLILIIIGIKKQSRH